MREVTLRVQVKRAKKCKSYALVKGTYTYTREDLKIFDKIFLVFPASASKEEREKALEKYKSKNAEEVNEMPPERIKLSFVPEY